jgi:transketolase
MNVLDIDYLNGKPKLAGTRDGYGEALLEIALEDEKLVVLTCDLAESTRVLEFAKKFPDRFIECGVAEQNMMSVAAGLALSGFKPVVSSYAVFSPGRNWDQLRVSVCYSKLPVIVAGAHTGLSVGPDGATHQALEDIAITRVLPGMNVVVPCDFEQTKKALKALVSNGQPGYIRFSKEKSPVITSSSAPFVLGKAQVCVEGWDAVIFAAGPVLDLALRASDELKKVGIQVSVVNLHTIKPIDEFAVVGFAKQCGAVVTVEEHQLHGGVGSAVSEVLSLNYPVPVEMVGVQNVFGQSGNPELLWEYYGLTVSSVVNAVKKAISRK